jgi:hypothetical protein
MIFKPFYEYFPEIAERETRAVTVMSNPRLPRGHFGLVEAYCDDPDCDCRRVMFFIDSSQSRQPMAVVGYGWESRRFYEKWMGDSNPELIDEMKGPSLNVGSPQSKYAPEFLKLVEQVLEDHAYVERLKRHYQMFKEHIKTNATGGEAKGDLPVKSEKIGRNQPCPCGSGKKYKKCCMGKLLA